MSRLYEARKTHDGLWMVALVIDPEMAVSIDGRSYWPTGQEAIAAFRGCRFTSASRLAAGREMVEALTKKGGAS